MELWTLLLSDNVGRASLAVIGATTVIVCVLIGIMIKRARSAKG
ncbi:DUF3149 domain-containing protein [Craterilacuibacter sp. RT1T]|nr:DUF3149 domain-containing protein [Craterilacuibacter sp. RT1T]MCL6262087.1 DUF3149 domain-containing protein [Craterilacuibacter sp. RT1T]MCP9758072.1 DUF3149 domain-containing protein [Aquitalea sp. S1-19]RQW29495.1 DUF3149 domain-containing protein [Rhodobacteraceae bacterium CH30]